MAQQIKKPGAATPGSENNTFVNTSIDSTSAPADDQLFTSADFIAWHQANADQLAAKRAAAEAVRDAEKAARLEAFTDATIRQVCLFMEDGFSLNETCESLVANAIRFGACHESLVELVRILQSLGWKPEAAPC